MVWTYNASRGESRLRDSAITTEYHHHRGWVQDQTQYDVPVRKTGRVSGPRVEGIDSICIKGLRGSGFLSLDKEYKRRRWTEI